MTRADSPMAVRKLGLLSYAKTPPLPYPEVAGFLETFTVARAVKNWGFSDSGNCK